jgi:hypothetical protein
MSIRSTIKIQGIDYCKIYKHWDGEPASMRGWLTDFNAEFTQKRGIDPEYKIAQCLRFAKKNEEIYDLDKNMQTGWGIVKFDADCGEVYEYTLLHDGTVTICDSSAY